MASESSGVPNRRRRFQILAGTATFIGLDGAPAAFSPEDRSPEPAISSPSSPVRTAAAWLTQAGSGCDLTSAALLVASLVLLLQSMLADRSGSEAPSHAP